jgi:basic membrane protein A
MGIKMKKVLLLVLALFAMLMLASCGEKEEGPADGSAQIAVVTDVGQLRDGGFNEGTWNGAEGFAKANGKTVQYYQPANGADATDADRIAAMRLAIENGAEIIVTPGFLQAAAITAVATESPNVKFVFVDGWPLGLDNVTAISYKEEESGFLAGYAAVMDGYTKLGGTFGGGGTNAACNRFAYGYAQGAAAAAKELGKNVEMKISFQYGSAFSASQELQTQMSAWYQGGTEIIFSCGGSMLQSVKAAAAETEKGMIIGVDVDQHGESDRVLTSAVKGLAVSVQKVLGEFYEGKWDSLLKNNLSNLGAADDSTGLPTNADAWRFKTFTVEQYNAVFAQIKNGTLVIKNDVLSDMNDSAPWAQLQTSLSNIAITLE